MGFFATLPRCVVAMEACASAHYWAREIAALGHDTRLIPPAYVKPFVKRQKNDMADAEAICEAAQRPTMRFVQGKSAEAQAAAVVFRTRDILVRQRTQLINALRGHLTEFGYVVRQGVVHVGKLVEIIGNPASDIPAEARPILVVIADSLKALQSQIALLDREIAARAKADPVAQRLLTVPGVGPVIATALVALAPAASTFRRGRDFAAWLGLVPRQHSSGGKERLGRTTKMGERSLRRLLILGASSTDQGRGARSRQGRCLAGGHAGTQAAHACHRRAGQQDGEDRLGTDGPWRILQSSGRGGITARARGVRDAGKVNREVWRNGQKTGSGKPVKCPGASSAPLLSGPDPRSPYRPAAVMMAASTGRTHGST